MTRVASTRVTVCGAGAIGANLIEHLARTGWRRIRVVDCDRVEPHNVANQPYGMRHAGRSKVRSLAELLFELTGVSIDAVHARIEPRRAAKLLAGSDLVVDALDNVEGRLVVRDACTALDLPCLHVGLAGDGYADMRWNDGYRVAGSAHADPCAVGYTRTLVLITVALAGEALVRRSEGHRVDAREIPFESLWAALRVPFGSEILG